MPIYNLVLVFSTSVSKAILVYAKSINSNFQTFSSIKDSPHITLLQFESKKPLSSAVISRLSRTTLQRKVVLEHAQNSTHSSILDRWNSDIKKLRPCKVTFAGLALLPSNREGVWVEISVLKSQKLLALQQKALSLLHKVKVINRLADRFRPHITLSRIHSRKNLPVAALDASLLRKKDVPASLQLRMVDKNLGWRPVS